MYRCEAHNICSSHLRICVCQVVAECGTMVTLSHTAGSGTHPANINTKNTNFPASQQHTAHVLSERKDKWIIRGPDAGPTNFHKQ